MLQQLTKYSTRSNITVHWTTPNVQLFSLVWSLKFLHDADKNASTVGADPPRSKKI